MAAALRKIIQMIPAGTWKARFKADPVSDKPLVCWALVEMGLTTQVVGMVVKVATNQPSGKLVFADEEMDFVTYVSD
jgi:hypothetical protein